MDYDLLIDDLHIDKSDPRIEEIRDLYNFIDSNNYCPYPFMHLMFTTEGDYKPCCIAKPYEYDGGKRLNLKDFTIEQIWNHPERKKLLQQFKDNKQPSTCEGCWKESSNTITKRKSTLLHPITKPTIEKAMNGDYNETLMFIDIRPGNICNLKCRICDPWNSSKWLTDWHAILEGDVPIKESSFYKINNDCNWFDNEEIWEQNVDVFSNLSMLHFLGGEPLLAQKHFMLLQTLVSAGLSTNIDIAYNTNGTVFPTDAQWKIYNQFKSVTFLLSIDDIGKRFEYQRSGANWNEVYNNIKKFQEKSLNDNVNVKIDCTISIFNVYYIDEFYNFLDKEGLVYSVLLKHFVTNDGMDIRQLDSLEKEKVIQHLEKGTNKATKQVIRRIKDKDLWTPKSQLYRHYRIQKVDEVRNEKFADVFPEYSQILNIKRDPR